MSNHNLDEGNEENFTFVLGGNSYRMRYPTTEEIQNMSKIKDEAKQTEYLYGLIDSESPDSPTIQDALKKVNVKVLQKFNSMIRSEFTDGIE